MFLTYMKKGFLKLSTKLSRMHLSFRLFARVASALVVLSMLAFGAGVVCAPHAFAQTLSTRSGPFDFGNQTIALDHEILHFTHGFARSIDGQHVAQITDRRVNQPSTRAAAIMIDNVVGSGIFFYAIGAARADGRESYSTPVFLGDRIKIETVNLNEARVTIDYLDHVAGVPLAAPPTQPMAVTYNIQADGSLQANTP